MDKTKLNKDSVSQRILETTQETERLKQELQNLIAAGLAGSKNYTVPLSATNLLIESTNKVQILKSYDPKHSQHIKKPSEGSAKAPDFSKSKNEAQAISPKKPKGYDVDKAREYIKKQRDKRKEEFKSRKTETKITAEMRKEKLQELQQKATELVKKNVEAKRTRSKSRDRTGLPRANESVIVGFNCAEKTKKHLEEPVTNQIRKTKLAKDPNLLYPPETVAASRKKISVQDPNLIFPPEVGKTTKPSRDLLNARLNVSSIARSKHSKSLQNLQHPPEPHYSPQKEPLIPISNKSSENYSKKITPKKHPKIVQSNITLRAADGVAPSADFYTELKNAPSTSVSHKTTEKYAEKQSSLKRINSDHSQATHTSKKDAQPLKNDLTGSKSAHSEPVSYKNHLLNESPKKSKINIISNITLKSSEKSPSQVEDRKEKIVTPEWLRDTMGQGDPYNFINTVKRQLKYVVNEKKPHCVDVGVQGNIEDDISEPKTGGLSKKSDLKSFISHKCLNLDPHTIQHIEIHRQKSHLSLKDGPTITNQYLCSDCDSDTSKNIPSISSESGTSLRRNAEFVKQSYSISDLKPLENAPPNLDTKTVDDIKLKETSKLSDSEKNTQKTSVSNVVTSSLQVPLSDDIERIKKKLFTDSDCYSSDFIPTDLSRSRDSLISFNCAKVSPNRVPDNRSKSENIDSSLLKSNGNNSFETGIIPKKHSQASEKVPQESDRKSKSLNSASEDGSQKRNSRSAQFFSLLSDLHRSTTDPDLNVHLQISEVSDSEVATVTSDKSESFTEVLKPKNLLTDSNHSQDGLSNGISENTKTVSSLKTSEKPTSEIHKSKSEQILTTKRNTSAFSKSESEIYENKENLRGLSLREPKLSLNVRDRNRKGVDESTAQALMKNISIRSRDQTSRDMNNTNEIHLKFEAEIHLLNDFNQSLRHLSEIEKAFESLRSKNNSEVVTTKVLQNRDTQTSIVTKTSTRTVSKRSNRSSSQISTINYSRGSGIDSEIQSDQEDNSELSIRSEIISEINFPEQDRDMNVLKASKAKSDTLLELTQGSDLSNVLKSVNLEDSDRTSSVLLLSQVDDVPVGSGRYNDENVALRNFAGMSLRMFDQLIKDEDARIENWKKIVKIREQALLDRTRGELVYLEMQKKQLIETGKMTEASLIKKKQRGILLKHQQERLEMQRLKQMQKEASVKRKTLLKGEKNLIKNQLLSDNMLSKLKPSSQRERAERRLSGPLKVIQATGSVRSETSLSKGAEGTDQEIKNITSRTCSVVISSASDNLISELEPLELTLARNKNMSAEAVYGMKKRLLMREQALAKRRKTVEELLQWHKNLLEEEKAIEDLENKVEKIISKIPSESNEESSRQPLELSKSISERTASDLNIPPMSQVVLERRFPSKEKVSAKSKSTSSEANKNIPQEERESEDSNKIVSSANYSTDFDVESVPEVLPQNSDDQSDVSSISQLIENFSKIEGNILNLSLVQKSQPLENERAEVLSTHSARTDSSAVEDIVHDEEPSEYSSHSNQIASEVEVKVQEELPSEVLEIVEQQDPAEDREKSVIIIEEPSEHSASDEYHKLDGSVEIEEIKEESPKKESEEIPEVQEKPSESVRTEDSENVPKSSLSIKELSLKEPSEVVSEEPSEVVSEEPSELVSVSEELKDTHVPDDSNKSSLRENLGDKVAAESSASVSEPSEDENAEKQKVSEEISAETNRDEDSLTKISTALSTQRDDEENEPTNVSSGALEDVPVKFIEDVQQSTGDVDTVGEDGSAKISSVCEESKPSASHQRVSETSGPVSAEVENIPSVAQKSSAHDTSKITDEPVVSVSNVDMPSTSRQTEEQATSSQILSLTKDDESSRIEKDESHGPSSSTPIIVENDVQSPSILEEERQSFENKTDEEKVASLSIRASANQTSGSISEDRARSSVSITRPSSLAISEPSVSGERSLTTSKGLLKCSENLESSMVSKKSLSGEISEVSAPSEEKSSGVSVSEERSKDFNDKDAEKSLRDVSKISESSKIDSVEEEKLPEASLIQEISVIAEGESRKSSESGKEASSSDRALEGASETSVIEEKSVLPEQKSVASSRKEDESVEAEENQSEASLVEDANVSVASSSSIAEKSASSEKPSKSSTSKDRSKAVAEKSESSSLKLSLTPEKSPRLSLDVKKRVQEILNEASPVSRGDKSPRMQDLCVMTYDLISPSQSPESGSPLEERTKSFFLGSEAEELLRKQLAIEQEIKLLTEQQQKEQAPQFYIREIPNKPPPPYTPPSKAKPPKSSSIMPSSKEEIEQITEYSAKIIHKAYLSNNLDNISISDNTLNLIAKNIDKGCYKHVFDLCREVAIDHYSQFVKEEGPSWLRLEQKVVVAPAKPLDVKGLKKLMNKKLLELFEFEKQEKKKENAIMKWSRKKRDHVDEVLVQEMQAQESSWTNFDRDELTVKDRITNEIMEMLLKETAQVLKKTVQKKSAPQ